MLVHFHLFGSLMDALDGASSYPIVETNFLTFGGGGSDIDCDNGSQYS